MHYFPFHLHYRYVISQNVDGLHKRSGIKPENMSELHGNIYLEVCDDCGTEYLRPFSVTEHSGNDVDCSNMSFKDMAHCTGRRCDTCKGILRDTIINFGEVSKQVVVTAKFLHVSFRNMKEFGSNYNLFTFSNIFQSLPSYLLKRAKKHSKECDLMLILGSSLTVSPANQLPLYAKEMVIVNLQKTEYDSKAAIRIFAKTDIVMQLLMEYLGKVWMHYLQLAGYTIPTFTVEQMKPTLIYQPDDPAARISRKPTPNKDEHPIVQDADKVNVDGLFVRRIAMLTFFRKILVAVPFCNKCTK